MRFLCFPVQSVRAHPIFCSTHMEQNWFMLSNNTATELSCLHEPDSPVINGCVFYCILAEKDVGHGRLSLQMLCTNIKVFLP